MALTAQNIEDVLPRIAALNQRFNEVAEIGQRLRRPEFWRSVDGKLSVGVLDEQGWKALEERIRQDLREARLLMAAIEAFVEEPAAGAV